MPKFNIHFLPMEITVKADTGDPPNARDGLTGSILSHALHNKIELDHACGGVCACSTCHVIVKQGLKSLSPATENEEDMLDLAPGLTLKSRLACQAIPNGNEDVIVEIPTWNRNRVKEGDTQ